MRLHVRSRRFAYATAFLFLIGARALLGQTAGDSLLEGFQDPPDSAKPRVWWHWMNGNVTWEGAKADMDWMKRVGIGGLQSFDAGQATPQVVDQRLPYMSPGWKDVFRSTAAYADKLDLELGIAASPGWSETGGPWVEPEDAMKKMVWSVTRVQGETAVHRRADEAAHDDRESSRPAPPVECWAAGIAGQNPPEYYADQKVIAFRVPADSILPVPAVTASGGNARYRRIVRWRSRAYSHRPARRGGDRRHVMDSV